MNKNRRVIALGFFDGVHNGHGALLRRVVDKARELDAVAAAFTFDRSPTAAITGQTVPLLSSVEDRGWLMRSRYGIQEVVVSNFDGMMRMDWEDFVDRYLAEELGAVHVVAGHDFHFGYMGKGNPRRLQEKCAQLGIGCDIIPKVEQDGITISSTYIRTLIAQGEMERAVQFLGHPHVLTQTGGPRQKNRQQHPGFSHGEPAYPGGSHRACLRRLYDQSLLRGGEPYRRYQRGGAPHSAGRRPPGDGGGLHLGL